MQLVYCWHAHVIHALLEPGHQALVQVQLHREVVVELLKGLDLVNKVRGVW
jgi:hypothetical protein